MAGGAKRTHPWLIVSAATLLLLLALQIVLAKRDRLAENPAWRPLLSRLCVLASCRLRAWHQPEAFVPISQSVAADRTQSGVLRVLLSFRNDAPWPQPWPQIEIRLSDVNGDALGLLAIGTVAELLLRPRRWAIVAMVSVASAQAAALWWQPVGAGNSILNFGLAGAVCAMGWLGGRRRRLLAPAVTASLCFGFLLAGHDIHGVAAISGALVAAALELGWPTQHTHGACN